MIFTEDRKNVGRIDGVDGFDGFDKTQTFSVNPAQSADVLKKRINEKNVRGLEEKSLQNSRPRPQTAQKPSQPQAVQRPAEHPAQRMAARQIQPTQQAQRPQAAQNVQEMRADRPTGAQQMHTDRPERPIQQNRPQPMPRQVRPQTGQAHPIRPQQPQPQQQQMQPQQLQQVKAVQSAQQARNVSPVQHVPQVNNSQQAVQKHPNPQSPQTDRQPIRAVSQLDQQKRPQEIQQKPSQALQKPEHQVKLAEKPKVRPQKPTEPVRVKNPKAESKKMMKTVTNQINIAELNVKKEDDEEYEASDFGGNTVISVVKAIVYIVAVLVVSVFLALAIIVVSNDIFAFVKSDEVVEVTVPEYATLNDIATILYENDIIKYPQIFKLYAVAKEDDQKYVAGTYSVNGMMNYDKLLLEFKAKKQTGTIRITIPEGYTTDEIIDLFVSKGIGTREEFVDVIQNYDFDYWFVKELEEKGTKDGRIYRLDGYLFPDTYEFYTNSSAYTVVDKLLARFRQIFKKDYRQQCEVFGYTVDEIITLASIIEKEAAAPSEFFTVSSVFHNRLNNPAAFPKLESDATVVYAIHHATGTRAAMKPEDKFYDTPYNTYMYDKLPPGPIANPSASAMLAALTPQDTNYYFFVSYGSKTYFSETKAQHDAYIAEFQRQNAAAAETTPEN